MASLWNLLSNSGLSYCTMKKTQCSKINHMLASYMKTFAVYMLVCKNLAEFTQRCLHHDQSWRNSDWTAGASKASQSFAAALLALSCHLFLDSDWTKHTCTNSAVFALESLSKNDLMICSNKDFIYAGNDLCHSFKNGNPGGFVGLGRTPSKASWAWWAGKKEHRSIILRSIN